MGNRAPLQATLPLSLSHCVEFGDSCSSVTKKSRRRYFGKGRPPASPRQWPKLGPPFAKTSGPSFRGGLSRRRPKAKIDCPPKFQAAVMFCCRSSSPFLSGINFDVQSFGVKTVAQMLRTFAVAYSSQPESSGRGWIICKCTLRQKFV